MSLLYKPLLKHIQFLPWVLAVLLVLPACKKDSGTRFYDLPPITTESRELTIQWGETTTEVMRWMNVKTPTNNARVLGYMGVALYEALVHADSSQVSLVNQLQGLAALPQPKTGVQYYWPLVAHYTQDSLFRLLNPYPEMMSDNGKYLLDTASKSILKSISASIPDPVISNSKQLGWEIARAIYQWSLNDGSQSFYNKPFDPGYLFPKGPSFWEPPIGGQVITEYPMHARWGQVRRFVPANSSLPVPAILPYSTDPASEYYKQYKAVYDKNFTLTQTEKDIAYWWADDPNEPSFSPPGHSYRIAGTLIRKGNLGLVRAAEVYARTGLAVADAFMHCWKIKYTYHNERPSSFARRTFDPNFFQYWPEPPFPGFPSGHSTQAASSATVWEGVFGTSFPFTDTTNTNQTRIFPVYRILDFSRSFNTLWDAALEAGQSRIYGGIHTRQDNETGLGEGRKVGNSINALRWRK